MRRNAAASQEQVMTLRDASDQQRKLVLSRRADERFELGLLNADSDADVERVIDVAELTADEGSLIFDSLK